jgi:hypothetical protein
MRQFLRTWALSEIENYCSESDKLEESLEDKLEDNEARRAQVKWSIDPTLAAKARQGWGTRFGWLIENF